jgi:HEAT repeat protein
LQEIAPLAKQAAETVVLAVDFEGLESLISELLRGLGDAQAAVRRGSADLVGFLFKNTKLDVEDEIPTLLSTLIIMLTDTDPRTVQASWNALGSITGTIAKENLPSFLKVVRDAVSAAKTKERRRSKGGAILIPGFCLPKALQPVQQIYIQGLMSGSAELREQAAEGLGELIDVTSEAALKPFVVPITGPLIRIIGDRFPWQVKSAILGTLGILISKGGIALKPFLPQLQTTFIKCLQDNTRAVRSRAAWALGKLTGLSTRVDPLVGDLISGLQVAEGGVKEAMLVALKGVMTHAGKSVSAPVLARVVAALQDLLPSEEEEVRTLSATTLGIVSQYVGDAEFGNLIQVLLTPGSAQVWTLRHGSTLAFASLLRHATLRLCSSNSWLSSVVSCLKSRAKDDKVPVREGASKAIGRLLVYQRKDNSVPSSTTELLPVLSLLLTDDSSDVRRRALRSVKAVAKVNVEGMVAIVGPGVADCLKDSSVPVRMAAERCAFHVFQLARGTENVQASQKYITGLDSRRIAKQPELSDASDDSEGDSIA